MTKAPEMYVGEKFPSSNNMLRKLVIHVQKIQTTFLSLTIYKNTFKMDQMSRDKIRKFGTARKKHRETLDVLGTGKDFLKSANNTGNNSKNQ